MRSSVLACSCMSSMRLRVHLDTHHIQFYLCACSCVSWSAQSRAFARMLRAFAYRLRVLRARRVHLHVRRILRDTFYLHEVGLYVYAISSC